MHLRGPVLIVCSDPECSSMLLGVIKDYGLEASAAADIRQARTHLQKPDLSLVLCESNLPDGSFRDLFDASALRTSPLRFVVLVRDEEGYSEAMRLGAFEAIPTPCRRSDVQWTMIRALRQAREPGTVTLRADRSSEEN
jgi:DNA-binding NtrC family response regulator